MRVAIPDVPSDEASLMLFSPLCTLELFDRDLVYGWATAKVHHWSKAKALESSRAVVTAKTDRNQPARPRKTVFFNAKHRFCTLRSRPPTPRGGGRRGRRRRSRRGRSGCRRPR